MNTNISLKTAQAADVAGVGYEGFRTWLKRGLLKETGALPKFYAAHAKAEPADAKRWRWSAFGFADLCSFRLTKILLDAALPWEAANSIVSDHRLWQSHRRDDPAYRYLAVFHKGSHWTPYSPETLAADLNSGIIKSDWMTLVDLRELRQTVLFRTRAAALRAISDDMMHTSTVFARTGNSMPTPDEEHGRRLRIEGMARELSELAVDAEKGLGSYQQFEAILHRLHQENKFPDNAAVSTVAIAFTCTAAS